MDWDEEKRGFRGAQDIAAYQAAFRLSREVNRFARKRYEAEKGEREVDLLHRKANLVAAKIAAGHALGYERDSLEKNIDLCREAKGACGECARLINNLADQDEYVLEIISLKDCWNEVSRELENRIKELEQLAWW